MHDAANTAGGRYGFVVNTADGRRFRERDVLWDEIPHDAHVTQLALMDFSTDTTLLELAGFAEYYFANEAVSRPFVTAILTGKIFGGVRSDGSVREVRINFVGGCPIGSPTRECRKAQLTYSSGSFRQGA